MTCIEHPDSTFLVNKLIFKALRNNYRFTEKILLGILEATPSDIFELYQTFLDRVPEDEWKDVQTLLRVTMAAARPLTVREMNIAVHVHSHIRDGSGGCPEFPSDEDFIAWVLHTCGFFVMEYDKTVHFIHQTAKEFLLAQDSMTGSGLDKLATPMWRNSITERQAHATMAECCIAYLSIDESRTDQFRKAVRKYCSGSDLTRKGVRLYKHYPLIEYVCRYWLWHFRFAQVLDPKSLQVKEDIDPSFHGIYMSLFDAARYPDLLWLRIKGAPLRSYDHLLRIDFEKLYTRTPAEIASVLGHIRLFQASISPLQDGHSLGNAAKKNGSIISRDLAVWIARKGSGLTVEHLISIGMPTDSSLIGEDRGSFFTVAAKEGNTDVISVLLGHGVAMNVPDKTGRSPLDLLLDNYGKAKYLSHLTIKETITRGARSSRTLQSVLQMPDFSSSFEEVYKEALDRAGTSLYQVPFVSSDLFNDPWFIDQYEESLIKFVLDNCPTKDCELHVDKGEYYEYYRGIFDTSIFSTGAHCFVLACLLQYGVFGPASVGEKSDLRWEPGPALCAAANCENITALRLFIEYGIDIDSPDENGNTALFHTFRTSKLLLSRGANANARNNKGSTPLHVASAWSSVSGHGIYTSWVHEKLELLLQHGADINARDNTGATPLHQACSESPNPVIISLLLRAGADVTVKDNQNYTPLHNAARSGCLRAVKMLLESAGPLDISVLPGHIDIEAQDIHGGTPLHHASLAARSSVVQYLLQFPISVDGPNRQRPTPLQLALRFYPALASEPRPRQPLQRDADRLQTIAALANNGADLRRLPRKQSDLEVVTKSGPTLALQPFGEDVPILALENVTDSRQIPDNTRFPDLEVAIFNPRSLDNHPYLSDSENDAESDYSSSTVDSEVYSRRLQSLMNFWKTKWPQLWPESEEEYKARTLGTQGNGDQDLGSALGEDSQPLEGVPEDSESDWELDSWRGYGSDAKSSEEGELNGSSEDELEVESESSGEDL